MLAPWKKSYDQPRQLIKSRDITLSTKVCLVKAMVFSVVMYGCESWTIKKAECRRIDAFELWCWRRLLRVPWTARRSNQFILKEISPEYSLERLILKLKLQYVGHLMERTDSLEKTLMLGKIEGGRRRGWTGKPGVLQFMGSQRVRHDWVTELNWEKRNLAIYNMHQSRGYYAKWNKSDREIQISYAFIYMWN